MAAHTCPVEIYAATGPEPNCGLLEAVVKWKKNGVIAGRSEVLDLFQHFTGLVRLSKHLVSMRVREG